MTNPPEQIQTEHAEKIQAKKDNDQAGNDIDSSLMRFQKAADRSGQGAHGNEYGGKAEHKAESSGESLSGAVFPAACKIENVNREHGQQAGGYKSDNTFQERNSVLQNILLLHHYL